MICVRFVVLLIVMQYTIEKCLLLYVHPMVLLPLNYPDAPLAALLGRSNFTSACFSSSSGPLPVFLANSNFLSGTLWYCIKKIMFLCCHSTVCLFASFKSLKLKCHDLKFPFCVRFCLSLKTEPCNSAEPSLKNERLYLLPFKHPFLVTFTTSTN